MGGKKTKTTKKKIVSAAWRLDMDEAEKARLVETLEYQIGEIERAELRPGEDEELEARRKLLQNAEKLSDALEAAAAALYGDEDSDGAAALLAQAEKALSRVKSVSDDVAALHQKVTELVYAAQDAAEEARDVRDELTYSAEELEQIEQRLDVLEVVIKRHAVDAAVLGNVVDGDFSERLLQQQMLQRRGDRALRDLRHGAPLSRLVPQV